MQHLYRNIFRTAAEHEKYHNDMGSRIETFDISADPIVQADNILIRADAMACGEFECTQ